MAVDGFSFTSYGCSLHFLVRTLRRMFSSAQADELSSPGTAVKKMDIGRFFVNLFL